MTQRWILYLTNITIILSNFTILACKVNASTSTVTFEESTINVILTDTFVEADGGRILAFINALLTVITFIASSVSDAPISSEINGFTHTLTGVPSNPVHT